MAFERYWYSVAPQLLSVDGSTTGLIQVTSTAGFKVKQLAILQSPAAGTVQVQIKRVLSSTHLIIGLPTKPITDRTFDASVFKVSDGAFIFAVEQEKVKVPENDRDHATYEQEPTVAWRVVDVDEFGRFYNKGNPLPVQVDGVTFDGELAVQLTSKDNDPVAGDVHDSIRIGDQNNELKINDDQSINVNIVQTDNQALDGLSYQYDEVLAVPSGIETTVSTIMAPGNSKRIQKIDVSGENIAEFRLKLNGVVIAKQRIWHSEFNTTFDFQQFVNGLKLLSGQVITLTVIHNRPDTGNFNATTWYL